MINFIPIALIRYYLTANIPICVFKKIFED